VQCLSQADREKKEKRDEASQGYHGVRIIGSDGPTLHYRAELATVTDLPEPPARRAPQRRETALPGPDS
jgi:hypothetical protein